MRILGIPLARIAWPAALVTAFLLGWLAASLSNRSQAASRQTGSPEAGLRAAKSPGGEGSSRGPRASANRSDDPAAGIAAIAELEDSVERTRKLLELIDRLGPNEFEAVVAAYRDLGIPSWNDYQFLLAGWAKVDPLAALAFLDGHTTTPSSSWETVLTGWALDNPDAAIEWAIANIDGDKASWVAGVIGELAGRDLDRATSLIYRLPDSPGKRETRDTLNAILAALTKQDPDSMKEWVSGIPEGQLRAGAARRVAMRLAATNPQEVARWAETLDPESRLQANEELTQPWALRAPEEALAWAGTLEGKTLHNIAEKITPAVAAKNPQLATQWLSQFDGDPAFDPARLRLAKHCSRKTPAQAADWIGRITDVATGEREFHRILDGWMERDPEGVLRYMENNTIPESVRQRAMRTLGEQEAPPE